jgi:hypothetical protein
MKDGFSLLLASTVILAGVVMWLLGIDPVRPFLSPNVVRQEPDPPPASSRTKAKQASKPTRSRIPQKSTVIDPGATQEVSSAAPIDRGDPILASTVKETIAKTHGEPALSTWRIDRGHDVETLVYTQDRGKDVAVISLKDGTVSSAYSPNEHSAGLLAGPAAPQPASIAIPPAAEAPKSIPKILDKTLAEVPKAITPPGRPSVQANVGTCGEYRDGKLTVKPCSEVPLTPSEWLAKGSGATSGRSTPAGTTH